MTLREFTHDTTRASACYSETARINSDEPRLRTSLSRKHVGWYFLHARHKSASAQY